MKLPSRSVEIAAPSQSLQAPLERLPSTSKRHQLINRLAGEVILRHVSGRNVLDLGHGAPELDGWVQPRAKLLRLIDAIDLRDQNARSLPFPDGLYDCVYSLHTFAHLGTDFNTSVEAARHFLAEVARVLAPAGTAIVMFSNSQSLAGTYRGLKRIAARSKVHAERGLTRYDSLARIQQMLPPELRVLGIHGLQLFVVLPHLLSTPIFGRWLGNLEWHVRDMRWINRFATYLLLELHRS